MFILFAIGKLYVFKDMVVKHDDAWLLHYLIVINGIFLQDVVCV
jgi:hypothetical protein